MPDASKAPYLGLPNEARRAARARARAPYEPTWLDELIQGVFGKEEPDGSVLDPKRDSKATANDIGQRIGNVLNLADPPKMALGKLAALVGIGGAVRIGGAKDLVGTHAFPEKVSDKIVSDAYLKAPSIGITSRSASDFSPYQPQLVFSAGKLEPKNYSAATLVNRDGYFANPTGDTYEMTGLWHPGGDKKVWNDDTLRERITEYLSTNKERYGVEDLRLGQMFPEASQALSIAASPSFSTLKEFEKSPYGAGALRGRSGERNSYWSDLQRSIVRAATDPDGMLADAPGYTRGLIKKLYSGEALSDVEAELVARAARSPSAMAELKVLDKFPISPRDTAVFVPGTSYENENMLSGLIPFRDAGFKIFNSTHLAREGTPERFAHASNLTKRLPNVAPPEGGFRLPPDLTMEKVGPRTDVWNDFINKGAGGSPPLSKAPQLPKSEPELTQPHFTDSLDELAAHTEAPTLGHSLKDPLSAEKWKALADHADEYNYVIEEAVKKHKIKPEMLPLAIDHAYSLWTNGHHHTPNWHKALEDDLKWFAPGP